MLNQPKLKAGTNLYVISICIVWLQCTRTNSVECPIRRTLHAGLLHTRTTQGIHKLFYKRCPVAVPWLQSLQAVIVKKFAKLSDMFTYLICTYLCLVLIWFIYAIWKIKINEAGSNCPIFCLHVFEKCKHIIEIAI